MRIIIEIDERETTSRKIIEPIGIEGQNAGAAPNVTSITASQITMMNAFDAIDAGPPVQAILQRGKTLPSAQVGVATSDTNAGPAPDIGKDLD
jgi:hypothetical protein